MAHSVTLESVQPRRVIVHYHLMKCAGTTVAAILDREFGDACYHVHRPDAREVISGDELAAFLRATPQARAVTSHHARYPVPRDAGEIFDCCPLRRPMDRLESLYEFVARDATQLLHPLAAGGVGRFFEALMEDRPGAVIDVQTTALSMLQRCRPPNRDDLILAVGRIRTSPFIVLVERFDESMVVAEYFLKRAWPELQLHYQALNTLRIGWASAEERERHFRERCGDELYDALARRNELDTELWHAAAAELARRIALVPSFASRLAEFRARCEAYRGRRPLAADPVLPA